MEEQAEPVEGRLAELAACPAFTDVDLATLRRLARDARVVAFATGETLRPAPGAVLVRTGGLLVRDGHGRTTGLVAPGELYLDRSDGHEQLEALEDGSGYVLDDGAVTAAWSAPQQALRDLVAAPAAPPLEREGLVRELMRAPVVTADAAETCRTAAERMRDHGVSCLVLLGHDRLGIVTDRDLRNRLVAAGRSAEAPVAEIGTWPARAVGPDEPVGEAHARMLVEGIHHLPVVDRQALVGVVTATDLLRAHASAALALRREIDHAGDVEGVRAAQGRLPGVIRGLLDAGTTGGTLGRVAATITDHIHQRLLALAADALGQAPAAYGWLAFGSQGRREQTVFSDQDTGLLVPDGLSDRETAWFSRLGAWMTDALEVVGYPRCSGGVMAAEPGWRGSVSRWRDRFTRWMDAPGAQALLHVDIAFDLRTVAGALDAEELLGPTISGASRRDIFLGRLAREATRARPPLGFLGRFVVDRSGGRAGTVDIKAGAMLPIANIARLHALARGGTERDTDARLRGASAAGQLSADLAATLGAGHDLALRLRLEAQVGRHAQGLQPDNRVDPAELPPFARSQLKETFRAIRVAQETVDSRYHTGMLA